MTDRPGELLARLGGGDRAVLAQVPQARTGFAAMGAVLLTTAGVATVSMFYALHDAIQDDVGWSVVLGLAWAVVILNVDRFLVITMGAARGTARQLVTVLLRLALSALTALVIATPLVLRIFSAEVDRQLAVMHARQPLTAGNGLLAQVQALSQLRDSNTAVQVTVDVTYLLFFLIQLLPVLTKVLLSLGPVSAYEQVARYQEQQSVDAARAARIVCRRLEEDKADAELRIEGLKTKSRIAVEEDMRQREEAIGRHANEHVADQMAAILDAALQQWSDQVRANLGAPEKSGQPAGPGLSAFPPVWPSTPPPQAEARPGYTTPASGGTEL
ncbi:MAG TPA: DUF4407 domain-containing protein [Streptosporangiaceae bacterium]|nr:DUF4407 domain-containing protein [Streptosporangiaceae bacterium]